jgi:hypothetical protein
MWLRSLHKRNSAVQAMIGFQCHTRASFGSVRNGVCPVGWMLAPALSQLLVGFMIRSGDQKRNSVLCM